MVFVPPVELNWYASEGVYDAAVGWSAHTYLMGPRLATARTNDAVNVLSASAPAGVKQRTLTFWVVPDGPQFTTLHEFPPGPYAVTCTSPDDAPMFGKWTWYWPTPDRLIVFNAPLEFDW